MTRYTRIPNHGKRCAERLPKGFMDAYAGLYGDKAARINFESLTESEMYAAVCRMANDGHSDYTISSATRLSVECVRRILGGRQTA